QLLGEFVARGAERLGGRVEVETVPGLVLDLGQQDRLAAQRGGARDPVAFGLHADDLRVGVLGDLPNERLAVGLGHPVPGLDPVLGFDRRVELRLEVCLVIAVVVHLRCHDRSTFGCALVRTCPVSVCGCRARSEDPHDRRPAATRSIHLLTICSVLLASSVAYGTSGCNAGARRSAMPARGSATSLRAGAAPCIEPPHWAAGCIDPSHWGRLAAPALRTG